MLVSNVAFNPPMLGNRADEAQVGRPRWFVGVIVAIGIAVATGSVRAQPGTERLVVIKAERVITVSGTEYAPGRIVIEDGKITGVGKGIEFPAGARVIDASRETVMPGFVHPRSRHDLPAYNRTGVHGDVAASDEVVMSRIDFDELLAAGYTAVCLVPGGADLPGVATVYRTAGPEEARVLSPRVFLRANLAWRSKGKATLRDALKKAQDEIDKVKKAREEWEKQQAEKKKQAQTKSTQDGEKSDKPKESDKPEKPKDKPKPEDKAAGAFDEPKPDEPKPDEPKPDEPKPDEPKPDEPKPTEPPEKKPSQGDGKQDPPNDEEEFKPPKIDAKYQPLVDLIQNKEGAKLLVELSRASDWLHLQDVLEPYDDLRFALFLNAEQSTDFHRVVQSMGEQQAEVILVPSVHLLPETTFRYNLMRELAAAGCVVTSATPLSSDRDEYLRIRERLALLTRAGLTRKAALQSLTLHPARMLGLEARIGSIEKDHDADLVFFDGDPLDPLSQVTRVMVLGEFVWKAKTAKRSTR